MRRLPPSLAFLLLAWFCVQQPQNLVVDAVAWLRGAGRFSHQQDLAAAVQVALARAADSAPTMVVADTGRPMPPPALPSVEVVSGKSPLILVRGLDVVPPPAVRYRPGELRNTFENRARDVPVPVPRA